MSNASNSKPQSETDALIQDIRAQLKAKTFDPHDHERLNQLVESLADSRGMTRLTLTELFGDIGNAATPALISGLESHPNPVVRRSCAKALAIISDPTAIPSLINALLNDSDTVTKGSAAGALAKTGEVAVPALLNILSSPEHSASAKGHVIWALSFTATEIKSYLYQEINADSPEIRTAIVSALAKVVQDEDPEEEAFNVLVKSLYDPVDAVRSEAAIALGNVAYKPAIPQLIQMLQHDNLEDRKSASIALMKSEEPTALDPLKTRLKKETEEVVKAVIKLAISRIEQASI